MRSGFQAKRTCPLPPPPSPLSLPRLPSKSMRDQHKCSIWGQLRTFQNAARPRNQRNTDILQSQSRAPVAIHLLQPRSHGFSPTCTYQSSCHAIFDVRIEHSKNINIQPTENNFLSNIISGTANQYFQPCLHYVTILSLHEDQEKLCVPSNTPLQSAFARSVFITIYSERRCDRTYKYRYFTLTPENLRRCG